MFASNMNKGFQMTFENGYTVSVQFGRSNYCENRWDNYHAAIQAETYSSKDAEAHVWKGELDVGFRSFPKGWLTPDEVASLIWAVSQGEEAINRWLFKEN